MPWDNFRFIFGLRSIVKGEQISADALKAQVTNNTNYHNLFDFAEAYAVEVEHKRGAGTLKNYRKYLNLIEPLHT